MELKKYLEFIKESIKEDIEEQSIWKLTEDDIQEIFLESVDEGYYIDIEFGFVENKQHRSFRDKKDIFTDRVIAGDKIRPAYWICIHSSEKITSEDVTSNLKFAMSIIAEKANADITLQDDHDVLDVDKVKIQGGLYADENTPASGYISLFVKQKETVEFTPKDIIEYYDIKIDENVEIRGENVYLHVELENLADSLLSNKSDHKNTLVNGMVDEFWDYYNASDYTPDDISLLQYTLSKENSILLVKSIIKEMGGLDQTINHIGDECSDEAYESVKGKSEEEVIDFLLKERFYTTLRQLFKDSEVCKEVKYFVAENEMDAHALENYKQVIREFDDIVKEELGTFQKVEKEVTKYYTTKDAEGNQTKKEYKEKVYFYILPFNNNWLDVHDVDFIKSESLSTIFNEYCANLNPSCNLNPNFSDYGDVDSKELNRDINIGLNRYLEKGYTGLN